MSDWHLDLDQWMGLIMSVVRQSFTVGAEVGVMADSTLKTITSDIALVRRAERSIAIDTTVGWLESANGLDRDVKRRKAVTGMLHFSGTNTSRAVVKVGAGQALV